MKEQKIKKLPFGSRAEFLFDVFMRKLTLNAFIFRKEINYFSRLILVCLLSMDGRETCPYNTLEKNITNLSVELKKVG
jgi:hypothetical protein